MQDNRAVQRNYEPDMINIRRNPYLVDYEEQRTAQRQRQTTYRQETGQPVRRTPERQTAYRQGTSQAVRGTSEQQTAYRQGTGQPVRRTPERQTTYRQGTSQAVRGTPERQNAYRQGTVQPMGRTSERQNAYRQGTSQAVRRTPERQTTYRQGAGQPVRRTPERQTAYRQEVGQGAGRVGTQSGRPSREAMLRARRRRQVRRQKIAVGIWAVCIIAICGVLFLNRNSASAAEPATAPKDTQQQYQEGTSANASGAVIQGLPVEKFTAHPEWTENFLTLNEYSRPGEALPEVKDVFVHYTANPGTSAAQNRSYFEQQKDVHMASVSAHFIIGYEGEIIQCVPLDEIAYAVAGRNYDSVSIECCYTAKDGSFTQETYDSLISLLAWLTDAYDLDTSHILRHYDSNGKKCPVYYTEHVDEWEQLKQDVKAYK